MGDRLKNKVAIVTGGGAGIGEAICKKFAQEGARVVVCGRPGDPVRDVVREIEERGGVAIPYEGDISEPQNAQHCVTQAIRTYGKLDILVNNAGVFPTVGFIENYPNEALDYLIKNNIKSTVLMTKYAIPFLQKTKGVVLGAGSEAGINGEPENSPYGGTKGFMHSFIRGVAVEQAQKGVRANCVCPGAIDTSWTHDETGPMSTRMEKQFIAATPMGRRGTPEEVANVYLFLASDEASYITGALVSVDGGITITKGPMGLMADKALKTAPAGQLDLKHSMEGDPVKNEFNEKETVSEEYGLNQEYKAMRETYTETGGVTWGKALVGLSLGLGLAAAGVFLNRNRKQSDTGNGASTNREGTADTETTSTALTTGTEATPSIGTGTSIGSGAGAGAGMGTSTGIDTGTTTNIDAGTSTGATTAGTGDLSGQSQVGQQTAKINKTSGEPTGTNKSSSAKTSGKKGGGLTNEGKTGNVD